MVEAKDHCLRLIVDLSKTWYDTAYGTSRLFLLTAEEEDSLKQKDNWNLFSGWIGERSLSGDRLGTTLRVAGNLGLKEIGRESVVACA